MKNSRVKKITGVTMVAMLLCGTLLMGCGGAEENKPATEQTQTAQKEEASKEGTSDASQEQEATDSQEPVADVDASRELVVYSNTDEAGALAMEEVGKELDIKVTVVRMDGGGEVMDRIIAEKNNPAADIVYGINHIGFAKLKAADCLQAFTPEWDGKVGKGLKDPEGYYYGVGISPILLAYNPAAVGDNAPADWTDLWEKPEWKGHYFVKPSTSSGTTQLVLSGILVRYRDENGELGISEEGWQAVADYFANAYIQQEGDDFFAMMTKGDVVWAGQNYSKGVLQAEKDYNAEFAWATPEVGVPFAVEMVGIVNGSRHGALAGEFLDYYGSAEVVSAISTTYPANADAAGNAEADLKALTESVTVQDIDYDFVAENLDGWLEKIELELIP